MLLAAQAAVAIENARLYESATKWSRQLESLTEVGNALAGEVELPRLLTLVAERVRELLDARLVVIAMPTPTGMRVAAAAGDDAGSYSSMVLSPLSKTARVFDRRSSERIDSVIDDPEIEQEAVRRLGATTGLFVPLIVRDRAIGVISAHDKRGADPRFTDDDQRITETFASRAAVVADLSTRVQRDALRRVVAAQELERRRLARELHDETGQALTSILLGLKSVEEAPDGERRQAAAALRELVVTTLQDVRRLAVELRPKALDDFGLVPALERLGETFSEQNGIEVQLVAQLGERLSPEIETALYRIVQEALTNVLKHAAARHVSILLMRKHSSVSAVIEDDGLGFVPSGVREDGLGLVGMRERLDLIDGRFEVESRPGSGTTIVAEVPVSDPHPRRRRSRRRAQRPEAAARRGGRHRGRRRGRQRGGGAAPREPAPARRAAARRDDAGQERDRGRARCRRRRSRREGRDALDAGRAELRARGVRGRRARRSTSSRRRPTPSSCGPCARSPAAAATCTRSSVRG